MFSFRAFERPCQEKSAKLTPRAWHPNFPLWFLPDNESGFLPGAKLSASELQQGAGAGSYFRAMPGQSAFIKPAGASEDASAEVHRGQPQGLRRGGCKLFCTICPERFSSAARRMKMKRRAPQPGSQIKQPSASRDKSLFCLGCWVSARGQPSQFLGL